MKNHFPQQAKYKLHVTYFENCKPQTLPLFTDNPLDEVLKYYITKYDKATCYFIPTNGKSITVIKRSYLAYNNHVITDYLQILDKNYSVALSRSYIINAIKNKLAIRVDVV